MIKKAFAFIAGCALAASASALELSKYPKAFAAPYGVNVIVAPTQEGNQALLQIKGIDHEMDGVVFLSDIVSRGGETRAYQYTRNGKERALVLRQEGWRGEYFEAFLPDQGRVGLQPDQDASEEVDTQALLALYQQQKGEGVQERIAQFDRDGKETESEEALADNDQATNAKCGGDVSTSVAWDTVSDENAIDLSIASYCGTVATEMRMMCKSDEAFKEVAQGIEHINCQFGDRLKLEKSDGTVTFTTARDEPNQGDFAENYLRNL